MSAPIGTAFERLGGALIDPAIVVPAELPLDLCGEAVRARLCVFTDHNNRDMALRPDLTLPVALGEVEARKSSKTSGQSVHRYNARAFRQPSVAGEPLEFLQVGFERFGAPGTAAIDAEAYGLVSDVAEEAGVRAGVARFGDLGLVPAFIEALAISASVKAGMQRAFREAGGVRAYLDRASRPETKFVASLAGLDEAGVKGALEAKLAREGVTHFGNRTQGEVILRLMEQAREVADGGMTGEAREVLEAVMAVKCHPSEAGKILLEIATASGLETIGKQIDELEERFKLIAVQAPRFLEGAIFSPAFGRRFTYYDGFVFEIGEHGERQSRPFGAGGRYDSLLSDLSQGEVSATAIGGVVRPDRLALAQEGSL